MSDGLCGPSNALKSFSGHIGQDRSLQQDRVASSSQPQINQFRTTDPHAAQAQDAHFNAVLNGAELGFDLRHTPSPIPPHGKAMHRPTPPPQASAATPDWAFQFQQMTIRPPFAPAEIGHAHPVQVRHTSLPQTETHSALPVVHTPISMQQQASPYFAGNQWPLQNPFAVQHPAMVHQLGSDADFIAEMDQWMASNGPTAEAAINAEMEALAQQLEAESASVVAAQSAQSAQQIREQPVQEESFVQEEGPKNENGTELAEAARKIVEVMDTTHASDKMKNSGFLSLMRKLADGNVVLKDQDFVDQNGNSVSSTSTEDEKKAIPVPTYIPVDLTRPSLGS